jgi:hypothetical protein
MLTNEKSQDEECRKAIQKIARSLEEIMQQVTQANMKLDHLIETYRDSRHGYAPCPLYDPFSETYQD